jgi:hypothetical protein
MTANSCHFFISKKAFYFWNIGHINTLSFYTAMILLEIHKKNEGTNNITEFLGFTPIN